MQRGLNIWKRLSNIPEVNRNEDFKLRNVIIKEAEKENSITNKGIDIEEGKIFENETKNINNLNKKRGRRQIKNGKNGKNEENNVAHDKFSHDNIKRKVKTHFHTFIIALLNMKSGNILNNKNKFGKISSSITQNITVEYNQKLFNKKIKDIIIEISHKFQDKNKNIISLEIVKNYAKPYDEIIKLLNLTYKEMYINYYLKSTKKTFEGYSKDESYESHLIKLEKKYGINYSKNFKDNAESLIHFFNTCKKRKRKHKNLMAPSPFLQLKINKNKSNIIYNENITKRENTLEFSNSMVSTWTQTNMILSEDDEDF